MVGDQLEIFLNDTWMPVYRSDMCGQVESYWCGGTVDDYLGETVWGAEIRADGFCIIDSGTDG
jgi:hypothetical protein